MKRAILLLLVLLGSVALGDTIIFTDEAEFLSMVMPDYYNETFDTWTWADPLDGSQTTWDSPVVNGYSWTAYAAGGLWSNVQALSTALEYDPLIITFTGNPVTAVGGYFAATDEFGHVIVGDLEIALSDGTVEVITGLEFRGFITDSPLSSIMLTPLSGGLLVYPQVDFIVGRAVPEPTSAVLVLAGLAGMKLISRRRKK